MAARRFPDWLLRVFEGEAQPHAHAPAYSSFFIFHSSFFALARLLYVHTSDRLRSFASAKVRWGAGTLFFPAKDFPKRRKIFAKTPSRESNSTATEFNSTVADFNSTAADFNFGQLSWHSSVMGSKSLRTNFVLVRGELSSSLSYPERSRKKNVVQISGKSHFA